MPWLVHGQKILFGKGKEVGTVDRTRVPNTLLDLFGHYVLFEGEPVRLNLMIYVGVDRRTGLEVYLFPGQWDLCKEVHASL